MPEYIIPNLKNACRLLKLLADQPDGFSIAELSKALDVPRTTMLRIVSTLVAENFLQEKEKIFLLGSENLHIGLRQMERMDIRGLAVPALKALSKASGETSHMAILSGNNALIVEVCDSPNTVRAASRAGTLADIHCSATGKVLLANSDCDLAEFMDPEPYNRRTAKTITTLQQLKDDLQRVKAQGWGIDDEEYAEGVRCLAAPVRNAMGEVCAAIGVTASTQTFPRKDIPRMADIVKAAADDLSLKLSGR